MTLADRICVLRDGLVEQVGTPLDLYDRPDSLFVAGFIGSPKMNFLAGKFAEPYGAATLGVRSEHLEMKTSGGAWKGSVVHAENLGSDTYAFVDVGSGEPIIVRQAGAASWQPGQAVEVTPIGNQVHRFDKAGKPLRH